MAKAPDAAIERIKAFGIREGYRHDEMSDLLFERFKISHWTELTPFKINILERIFRAHTRAKRGKNAK